MSSRNKSFSPSRILLIKTSSFALIRSFRVSFCPQLVVAHTGMRLSAKTLPLRSRSANEVGPCGFPLTSQAKSLLPGKAFALLQCPFTHFIKAFVGTDVLARLHASRALSRSKRIAVLDAPLAPVLRSKGARK